jgi:hypothetical protein
MELLYTKANAERKIRKSRRDWEDNIKVDLRETKRRSVGWIYPTQNKVQWTPNGTVNSPKAP